MANPLKMLKLKPTGFQFMQDIPIKAPPSAVWKALLDVGTWFRFDEMPDYPQMKLDPRIGGLLTAANKDGSVAMLGGVVMHMEREKLLRINGTMGASHVPVMTAMIWELAPQKGGTRLRFCQRTFGYITADMKKNYQGGWKRLWPQLKALAERNSKRQ